MLISHNTALSRRILSSSISAHQPLLLSAWSPALNSLHIHPCPSSHKMSHIHTRRPSLLHAVNLHISCTILLSHQCSHHTTDCMPYKPYHSYNNSIHSGKCIYHLPHPSYDQCIEYIINAHVNQCIPSMIHLHYISRISCNPWIQ